MTIQEARRIVDSKLYKHPQYREARLFIHDWMMQNDEGYAHSARRIEAEMFTKLRRATV